MTWGMAAKMETDVGSREKDAEDVVRYKGNSKRVSWPRPQEIQHGEVRTVTVAHIVQLVRWSLGRWPFPGLQLGLIFLHADFFWQLPLVSQLGYLVQQL